MTTNSLRAAIYVRISSDRTGEGLGVERQEGDCRRKAESLGWAVVKVYSDNDVSAYSGAPRPQLNAMLDAVRRGEIDGIITWHNDRLYRRTRELLDFVDLAEETGVRLATVNAGDFDLSTPTGQMIAKNLVNMAEYEIGHSKERMKAAAVQRAERGRSHGPVAWGWTRDPDGTEHLDPEPAEAIREAARRTIAGESLRGICTDFNARGVKAPRGGEWVGSTLRQVLLRQRNAGRRVYYGKRGPKQKQDPNYGKVTEGAWPSILSGSEQDQVTEILTKPTRSTSRGGGLKYMMSNYLICGRCGGRCLTRAGALLPGEEKEGRRRPTSYACGDCYRCVANVGPVDEAVGELVVARLQGQDGPILLSRDKDAAREAQEEIEGLRARLNRAAAMFADGTIDGEQLATTTASIRKQIDKHEQVIARHAPTPALGNFSRDARATSVREAWDRAPVEVRRAIVEELVEVTLLPSGSGKRWTPDRLRPRWIGQPAGNGSATGSATS